MVILITTLTKMLELFLFILIGYLLRKRKYLPDNAGVVLSKLENNVLMPALIINTFVSRCTLENLITKGNLILWEAGIILFTGGIAFVTAKIMGEDVESERIIRYALVVPNFAFMGNALVESVFGNEMLYQYMIFTIPLNIFAYTVGIMWLMPEGQKKGCWKSLINPIFISLIFGMIVGISGITLPDFVMHTIENAGKCMAPVAMILTGFIIGGYEIKKMLADVNLYVLTTLRLVILPVLVYVIMNVIGADEQLKTLAVITLTMPFGLNTIIITAAYGGDTRRGAAMTLVSNVLAVVTIPIILTVVMGR